MATRSEAIERTGTRSALFDPDRLAFLEVAGWKAYYDRKWVLAFWQMVKLCREQFGLSWLRSLQGAYYITRASIAWAPVDHNARLVRRHIRKFYRVAARHGKGLDFDPDLVTNLEFRYWDVHRRLSGRPDDEKLPLVRSFVDLHSALFGLPKDQMWQSAVARAHSTDTVDLITSRRSTDVEGDWRRAEDYLREAYRSIKAKLD